MKKGLILLLSIMLSIGAAATLSACDCNGCSETGGVQNPNDGDNTQQNKQEYTITLRQTDCEDVIITVKEGESLTAQDLPAVQSQDGYTIKWNLENVDLTNISKNIIIDAQRTPKEYQIVYEPNGGTFVEGAEYATTATFNSPLGEGSLPDDEDITKENCELAYWYYDDETKPIFETTAWNIHTANGVVTLTAKWRDKSAETPKTHTVTFDMGGDGNTVIRDIQDGSDISDKIPIYSSEAGYTYDWKKVLNGETTDDVVTDFTNITESFTVKLVKTANTYTLTLDANGGTFDDVSTKIEKQITYGATIEVVDALTKTGHTFGGWFENAECTGTKYEFTTMPAQDITLYAKWNVNTCTVTFDSDGGSTVAPQTVEYNKKATKPDEPEKEGHTFDGWFAEGANTAYDFDTPITEAITLTAKWTIDEYDVIFVDGGTTVDTETVEYNKNATEPDEPEKVGHTFDGWFIDGTEFDFTTPITGNITLTAKWTANKYTLTLNVGEGSVASNTKTVIYGKPVGELPVPTYEGYNFQGWFTAETEGENVGKDTVWNIAGDGTWYARWKEKPTESKDIYFVTGNGTVSVPVEDGEIPEYTGEAGYEYSWNTEADGTGNIFDGDFSKIEAGTTLYPVKGNAIKYKITFEENGGDTVEDIEYTVESETITLGTPTKEGYTFDGWYNEKGEKVTEIAKGTTGDITLTGRWTIKKVKIIFDSQGGSVVSEITQEYGTQVTKPTTPTWKGYRFDGWFENEDGTGTAYEFTTMPAQDITLYAKWSKNSYKISFNSNGGTSVDEITAEYQAGITAPDEPTLDGYTFGGWFESGAETAYQFTIMPAENITLYAQWKANTYTFTFDANSGEVAVETMQVIYDSAVGELPTPTRDNHTFLGWYTEKEGGEQVLANTVWETPSDTTLYAHWEQETIKVTFNLDAAKMEIQTIEIPKGDSVKGYPTITTTPTKGFEYTWDKSLAELTNLTKDIEVTVSLSPITYDVTLNANGGTINEVETDTVKATTGETPNWTEPTRKGYTFVGWYTEKEGGTLVDISSAWNKTDENLTLYAHWTAKEYTLRFVDSSGDELCDDMKCNYGDKVKLPELDLGQYVTLVGWIYKEKTYDGVITLDFVSAEEDTIVFVSDIFVGPF